MESFFLVLFMAWRHSNPVSPYILRIVSIESGSVLPPEHCLFP